MIVTNENYMHEKIKSRLNIISDISGSGAGVVEP
jgi:hypothetical protein